MDASQNLVKNLAAAVNTIQAFRRDNAIQTARMHLAVGLAEAGASHRQIDQYAGLSQGTIGTWASRYPQFGSELQSARERYATNQTFQFMELVQKWEKEQEEEEPPQQISRESPRHQAD